MYADLVSPSRLDLHFQQGKFAVSALNLFGYLPVRYSLTARSALTRTARGHACAADHIAADSGIDGSLRHLGPAMHQGDICLLDLPAGELLGELSMSQVRFGHQHQSARFFVQPMDNSW